MQFGGGARERMQSAGALLDALDADSDPTGFEGFHRLIGESPAVRSRLRALCDETEGALTTPPGSAR
jgi:hypothetical protein